EQFQCLRRGTEFGHSYPELRAPEIPRAICAERDRYDRHTRAAGAVRGVVLEVRTGLQIDALGEECLLEDQRMMPRKLIAPHRVGPHGDRHRVVPVDALGASLAEMQPPWTNHGGYV